MLKLGLVKEYELAGAAFWKLGFEKEYRQGLFEGLKTAKSLKKTPVFPGRFKRELAIQMELIAGTVIYIYELSRRKLC